MAERRGHGEGGLHWEESRQRWVATVYLGYTPLGRRRKVKVSARTKTSAKAELRKLIRDREDGRRPEERNYTVESADESWLTNGLSGRSEATVKNRTSLARNHIIPSLGQRRLSELTADEVSNWLAGKATSLSSDTLRRLSGILRQAIRRAEAQEIVHRNVAMLVEVPRGIAGRPSKSLDLAQAQALLEAANAYPAMKAYIVLSLVTGARTEELRALTWDHVSLDTEPPFVELWRSVREGSDTKTSTSRRTLELPRRAVDALRAHQPVQQYARLVAGDRWVETGLVFASNVGTQLDASNVRRAFCKVVHDAGLDETAWTPRELRHSFVSLLSSSGVPIEDIARLVGHANTRTTEKVYRKELRPVLTRGAAAMDEIFSQSLDGT